VVYDEFPYYRSSQNHLKFAQYWKPTFILGIIHPVWQAIVEAYIGMHDKHPPLVKYYYAFMTWLFEGNLDYLRSVRIGVMLLFILLCLRILFFMEKKWDLFTGLVVSCCWLQCPVFGHAHISALDTVISCINTIVIIEFFYGSQKNGVSCGWFYFWIGSFNEINAFLFLSYWIMDSGCQALDLIKTWCLWYHRCNYFLFALAGVMVQHIR